MKLPASLLVLTITTPALGFLSWLKTEETPAYTPCDDGCFSEPKCCSAVLEAVHPDECFLPYMQPAGFADFGDICYNAGPGFMGIGGLGAACCTSDTVPADGSDMLLCMRPSEG